MRFANKKSEAFLILLTLGAIVAVLFLQFGCSNVRGFQYADDGPLSPYAARQAAEMARAEAEALDRIADRDSELASGIANAATGLADSLGAPAAVGGIIGALSTLWIPPPGTRRKRRDADAAATNGSNGNG